MRGALAVLALLAAGAALGQESGAPVVSISIPDGATGEDEVATGIQILLALTILALAPSSLIVMTSFTRIIIVLAILGFVTAYQVHRVRIIRRYYDKR